MKNKIKFYPDRHPYIEWEKDCHPIQENPTSWEDVPDGVYYIRGDEKEHATEYYVKNNIWYLADKTTKDRGHRMVNIVKFGYLPSLPERVWEELKSPWVYNKLTPQWKLYVEAKEHWDDLKQIRRDVRFIRFGILDTY